MPRPLGEQTYACEYCGNGFTRAKLQSAKPPKFCDDVCREARRHRQRPFGEWRVANPYAARLCRCEDCGVSFSSSGKGPAPSLCPACRTAKDAQRAIEWAKSHPEATRFHKVRWAALNPDKVIAARERAEPAAELRRRVYQAENADRVRAWKRDRESRRRALRMSATVVVFRSIDIFIRDLWTCGICREPVDQTARHPDASSPSLDHIIPLSRGGAHEPENVQLAHLSCNMRKGASLP